MLKPNHLEPIVHRAPVLLSCEFAVVAAQFKTADLTYWESLVLFLVPKLLS
jgi:hypothetical protein